MRNGRNLREQTPFEAYLRQSKANSNYIFREHLRAVAGAIETFCNISCLDQHPRTSVQGVRFQVAN